MVMISCLLVCRSLTYARRIAQVLGRHGIVCDVIRTPRSIARDGCGYSVKFGADKLKSVIGILKDEGVTAPEIYRRNEDGTVIEVER